MKKLHIVKIGGKVVADEDLLAKFLDDFGNLKGLKILVHGGGNIASDISNRLGVNVKMQEGRRITDADALDIAVMTYAGLINKNLVAKLQARHCNALGLSGADLNTIRTTKRQHPTIDYGFVGDGDENSINTMALRQLLNLNIVPVYCAITHDGSGQLFNTNADTMASLLARSLAANYEVTLSYCFEKDGVLADVDDENSVIPEMNHEQFITLKNDGTIHEGMIPKLENAFDALKKGVRRVSIKHPSNLLTETGTQLTS